MKDFKALMTTDVAPKPAIFLDRDGVINRDKGFVCKPEDFEWIEGAKEAIRMANKNGYLVFVVTNQGGVAKGLYKEADINAVHSFMLQELTRNDAKIDQIYYCPHHPEGIIPEYTIDCLDRKPSPGMILKAFSEWPLIKEKTFMIGNKASDMKAAESAGINGYLFSGGNLQEFLEKIIS